MTRLSRTLTAAFAAGTMFAAGSALAAYPDHPVNMVVPFAAGGPTDNVARSLAEAMRPTLGETIVVETKAARAAPSAPTRWPVPSPMATRSC